MIVYVKVLKPTGTNRCLHSDCYLCPQGGCSIYPAGEVRISVPDIDDLIRERDAGTIQILHVILSDAEKRILSDAKTAQAERGTQCRL